MHYNVWINVGNLFIRPCKYVKELAKKNYIDSNFLRSASDSYIDVLDDPWFDRDVDRLGLSNVPQIPFRRYLIDLKRRLKRL